jgi:hypothetical protein
MVAEPVDKVDDRGVGAELDNCANPIENGLGLKTEYTFFWELFQTNS